MRYLYTMIAALGLLLLGAIPASADDHEASFAEPGPVDLSGYGEIPNTGAHLSVGSLGIGPGEWTVTASVRLVVEDGDGKPAADQKNSQGCSLNGPDGEKLGGAGGSSSLWTAFDGGKDVTFTEWWDGQWHSSFVVTTEVDAMVELVCFIDASHSGVTEGDRSGMAATDVEIHAVRTVEAEACEWDDELLADDPECVEPVDETDETDEDTKDEQVDETETETTTTSPKPVPTAVPAGAELPKTGVSPLVLTGAGLALLLAGGAALLARRRTE